MTIARQDILPLASLINETIPLIGMFMRYFRNVSLATMFIAVAISAVLIAAFVGLENYLFDGVYGATATLFIFPILLAVVFRLIWGKRAIFPGLLLGLMVGWIYTAGLIGTMKL